MRGGLAGAVALVLALAACTEAKPGKQTARNAGAAPPDTSQAPKSPPPAGGTIAGTPGAQASGPVATEEQPIQVSNTLKRPMKVTAVVGNQRQPLGTVKPKQEASFTVRRPVGTTIVIMASDSTNQHEVQAALMAIGTVWHFVIR